MKISNFLENISNQLCIYLGSTMIIITGINVFTRYVLHFSLPWANELARYCFVWISLLGSSTVHKRLGLAQVTIFYNRTPIFLKKYLGVIIQFFILLFSLYAIKYGWNQTMAVRYQYSAAMRVSMSWVYVAIPIGFLFILVHSINIILNLCLLYKNKGKKQEGIIVSKII